MSTKKKKKDQPCLDHMKSPIHAFFLIYKNYNFMWFNLIYASKGHTKTKVHGKLKKKKKHTSYQQLKQKGY